MNPLFIGSQHFMLRGPLKLWNHEKVSETPQPLNRNEKDGIIVHNFTCITFMDPHNPFPPTPGVDPTKLFFLCFLFFGVKLSHFPINNFFLYVTKMQA